MGADLSAPAACCSSEGGLGPVPCVAPLTASLTPESDADAFTTWAFADEAAVLASTGEHAVPELQPRPSPRERERERERRLHGALNDEETGSASDSSVSTLSEAAQAASRLTPEDEEDVRILLLFYSEFNPQFANHAGIRRVCASFKRRARPGEDWRELMYAQVQRAGGGGGGGGGGSPRPDPREHWRRKMRGGGGDGDGLLERLEASLGLPSEGAAGRAVVSRFLRSPSPPPWLQQAAAGQPVQGRPPPGGAALERFVAEEEQAALQIQRHLRGASARRRLKDNSEEATPPQQSVGGIPGNQVEPELKAADGEDEKAPSPSPSWEEVDLDEGLPPATQPAEAATSPQQPQAEARPGAIPSSTSAVAPSSSASGMPQQPRAIPFEVVD